MKKDKFIQINIVVDDIYRTAKAWAAILDIPVPEITVNNLQSNGEYPYSFGVRRIPVTCWYVPSVSIQAAVVPSLIVKMCWA